MDSPEDALAEMEKILEVNPNDAAAWNSKGVLLARMDRFGDALRSLDRAAKLDPELAQVHSNRGRVLMALGPDKAKEALRSFERALELTEEDLPILLDKALALRVLGRTKEELECYQSIVALAPLEWGGWLRLGDVQLELGSFNDAVESYSKALEIDASLVPVLTHKAIALGMLDKWKEAIKAAETATKLSADDVETWRVLADVNLRAGKFKSAMKALKKAAKLDPEDASIENTMGMVEYKSGNLKDSVHHFERAVVRDKKHSTALRNLGLIYMELEEWEDAKRSWERFTSLVKKDPDSFDAKATTLARLDDFCGAADAWEKSRKLYKKKGDKREAERVTSLGRAARINCSRQKKAFRAAREKEKATRSFDDRFEMRRSKKKGTR